MKYETEEEQVEAIKNWWKQNGTQLLLGILVIVLVYTGWQYWQNKKYAESVYASSVFEAMQVRAEQGQLGDVAREGLKLMEEQPDSPYSTGVALLLAKFYMEKGEKDRVVENYQWAVEHASDASLKTVAQLRFARYYADQKQFDKAQAQLDTIKVAGLVPAEKANYDYVSGTLALFQGKTAEAKKLFTSVMENKEADDNIKAVAQLQLDDLS
jgi:predicted negative regulator of RcsB-dependent stress response